MAKAKKADLFWSHVKVGSKIECWPWIGSLDRDGYGRFRCDSNLAHRFSYELTRRRKVRIVRHTCDNRRCVNPSHLIGGTQKQNVDDSFRRGGRIRKLTSSHRRSIRLSHKSHSALARRFKVSVTMIRKVRGVYGKN